MVGIGKFIEKGRRFLSALSEDKCTTIAGTLVFFLIMSLVPLSFWATLLLARLGLDTEAILSLDLFEWAKELLVFFRGNAAEAASGAGVFFLLTTLWSSTGFFYHMRKSGEIVYGYRRKKQGWKVRISAIALTLLVLFFLVASVGVLVGAITLTRGFPAPLPQICIYTLMLVLGFFAAWILNGYICPYRVSPSDTLAGSALTAGAWLAASVAFSVYLALSNKEKLYGALTLFIVFLLWLYWMMICFTAGAIVNSRRLKRSETVVKKY